VGDRGIAIDKLVDRLSAGIIIALATTAIFRTARQETRRQHIAKLDPNWWKTLSGSHAHDLWRSGDATFHSWLRGYDEEITYLDIRFDPIAVRALLPKPKPSVSPPVAAPPPKTTAVASNAGRLRKSFWDDLLIAMFEQLWDGSLPAPTCAADIERAMLEWAENNEKELGATSVKEPARKLYKAYKKGVGN
jgi:hypothetical protein